MDIHQRVHELRTRIKRLRAQLELNNTNTDLEPAGVVVEEPEPAQTVEQPSAAEVYKARLMGKKSS